VPPRSPHAHGPSEVLQRPGVAEAYQEIAAALGRRVRALRHERAWTQESTAERVGVHPKQIQRIEAGRTNCTLATLVALSTIFEVPVSALFAD